MAKSLKVRSQCCFSEWMHLQEQDLNQLLHARNLNATATSGDDNSNESLHTRLTQKSVKHFEDYAVKRSQLFHENASTYFAPTWCSSLENSSLWIGGCRPSSFFRLLYAYTSSNAESLVAELIAAGRAKGDDGSSTPRQLAIGGISAKQLATINSLHIKTVKEEDKMTSKWASLQEDMADQPLCVAVDRFKRIGEPDAEVESALDQREEAMANLLQEADQLRLTSLKDLLAILTPAQSVDFLAVSKKLHLNIHEWGKRRDCKHGSH